MRPISDPGQLGRFFAAYAEHAFLDHLGVVDTPLVDYLSGLLVRFVHRDQIFPLRPTGGVRMTALSDMVEAVERAESVGPDRRELFRHIGDFTLFWTGVFPEAVTGRPRAFAVGIEHFTEQGKRSYYVASTYRDTPEQADEAPILRRLSDQFEVCAVGLRRARDLWEADHPQLDPDGP